MYSRNLSGRSNEEKYRVNVPPQYHGSRLAHLPPAASAAEKTPASGAAAQDETRNGTVQENGATPVLLPDEEFDFSAFALPSAAVPDPPSEPIAETEAESPQPPAPQPEEDAPEPAAVKTVNARPQEKRGGLFSGLLGGGNGGRFSYEDLLLAGLILLISSSERGDNEDILIILALLLAYR